MKPKESSGVAIIAALHLTRISYAPISVTLFDANRLPVPAYYVLGSRLS